MSAFCPYFNRSVCRSCDLIEQDYAAQIAVKEQKIKRALSFFEERWGPFRFESSKWSAQVEFRNRAKLSVTGSVSAPVIGLLGEADLDLGRELLNCPIHHPLINQLLVALPDFITRYNLTPYQITQRKGELKGLIIYYSPLSEQMYLRFILRSKECVARLRKLAPDLQGRFESLQCISANVQPVPHALLEGEEEIFLTERTSIDHQMGPLKLTLSPQAFVQTNFEVATKLYETAAKWVGEIRPKKMLELFCGQGAFSFFSAQSAGEILGIEINEDAVKSANDSAEKLGLRHLRFEAGDADRIDRLLEVFSPDLILVNPPRRGLALALQLIERQRPAHVIYSSCDIKTLESDLRILKSSYSLRRAQLFDMFPHTSHFETLVWLSRG